MDYTEDHWLPEINTSIFWTFSLEEDLTLF